MRETFHHIALAKLCGWFGITRQAYYQENWKEVSESTESEVLLKEVLNIRKNHKRIGTRKLYKMLAPVMNEH